MKKLLPKYNWKDRDKVQSKINEYKIQFKYIPWKNIRHAVAKNDSKPFIDILYFELSLLNQSLRPFIWDSFKGDQWTEEKKSNMAPRGEPTVIRINNPFTLGKVSNLGPNQESALEGGSGTTSPYKKEDEI